MITTIEDESTGVQWTATLTEEGGWFVALETPQDPEHAEQWHPPSFVKDSVGAWARGILEAEGLEVTHQSWGPCGLDIVTNWGIGRGARPRRAPTHWPMPCFHRERT